LKTTKREKERERRKRKISQGVPFGSESFRSSHLR
jgi:hypothetical protein